MSSRPRRVLLLTLLSAALSCALAFVGCGDERVTEIVIEVRSDLRVPDELDAVVIEAMGPGGKMATSRADLTEPDGELPRTLTLVHTGGDLGPVHARVEGMKGGALVVARALEMEFEPGASLRIVVHLSDACRDVRCGEGSTCEAGSCRPVQVRPCEFEGRSCADAGMDAGPDAADAGGDADAGPGCVLDDGICGVTDTHLPGDRLTLAPCAAVAGDVTLDWTIERPTAEDDTGTGDSHDFVVVEVGTHTVTVTASEPAGCSDTTTFEGAGFDPVDVPEPGTLDGVRDMDARPGMAFFATATGGWAVTTEGSSNLGADADSGTMVSDDLQAVAVLRGDALFMSTEDDGELTRAGVAADLSSIVLTSVTIPSGAERSGRSMATPSGGHPGGDPPADLEPLAAGTKEDVVVYQEDAGGNLSLSTSLTPKFEAIRDVAVGRRETEEHGAVWALQRDRMVNYALGPGSSAVAGSAELTIGGGDVAEAEALALDDRDRSLQRLWICASDTGAGRVEAHDLEQDWSEVTSTMPAPLNSTPLVCRDIAVGAEADAWVATSSGLERFGPDGVRTLALQPDDHGVPAEDMAFVATAWDETTREVWVYTAAGELYRAFADRMP